MSRYLPPFQNAKTFFAHHLKNRNGLYLGTETPSCCLLQRMTRMNMDWNLKKLGAANLFMQVLERFSYDLEMKTSEQNRKNKRTNRATDWFIERI